jgi:hypothetical protein
MICLHRIITHIHIHIHLMATTIIHIRPTSTGIIRLIVHIVTIIPTIPLITATIGFNACDF